MSHKLQPEHRRLLHKLGISWVVFTLIIFFMVLFYRWEHLQLQNMQLFQHHANHLAFQTDEFLENILEAGHTLPYYQNDLGTCKPELLRELRSIVFNHPNISAVAISDANNHLLCASSDLIKTLPPAEKTGLALYGPMTIAHGESEVFLLQQRLGEYHIGMYFIRPLLENYMQKNGSDLDSIILYDNLNRKILAHIGTMVVVPGNPPDQDETTITLPLQTIDHISLIVTAHPLGYLNKLLITLFLTTLPFLLLSWIFYKYVVRMIGNRYSLSYALGNALKQNQFHPAYQAIWDESENRFCAAEVLVRWHTELDDVIMPDYFIDEAERSGLIVPITLQLMEKTFQESRQLLRDHPYFYLSFNVSPHHFRDPVFFPRFYELCAQYAIRADQLMLELTERELFNQNDEEVVGQMNELRQRGYHLGIDDFGTGHANLHYLQHFPFNYLKIDKLFISSIGTGAITETLNQSIISMAKSLGLQIIAEGVETQIQRDYLCEHQVFFIQGWFYTKALPFSSFSRLINRRAI